MIQGTLPFRWSLARQAARLRIHPSHPRARRIGTKWASEALRGAWARPHMAVGFVLAAALVLLPIPQLRILGWVTSALFHETGHVAFSWFVGSPAFPVLLPTGHAATLSYPQTPLLVVALGGLVLAWGGYAVERRRRPGLVSLVACLWLSCVLLEELRTAGTLLSGHLGELAFAGLFLWRARTGEAVHRPAERFLYAGLGWFLILRTVHCCAQLALSDAARAFYERGGSFGLENDLVAFARGTTGGSVEAAACMLAVAALVVPLIGFHPRLDPGETAETRYPRIRLLRARARVSLAPCPAAFASTDGEDLNRPEPG